MVQHYRLHTHGQPSVTADYLTHASLIDDALAQETIGLQSVKPCRFRAASDLELIDTAIWRSFHVCTAATICTTAVCVCRSTI